MSAEFNTLPTEFNTPSTQFNTPFCEFNRGFLFFICYACIVSEPLQELATGANLCTFAVLIYIERKMLK